MEEDGRICGRDKDKRDCGRKGRDIQDFAADMAEQFVGLTMLVTLSSPLDAQLRGRVSSVVAGQSLTLSDGMFTILWMRCCALVHFYGQLMLLSDVDAHETTVWSC